jgi:hypothetical protein
MDEIPCDGRTHGGVNDEKPLMWIRRRGFGAKSSIGASWDLTQPEDAAKINSLLRHIELLSK